MTDPLVILLSILVYIALLFGMRFAALKLLHRRMGQASRSMVADAPVNSAQLIRPATELKFRRVDTQPASVEAVASRQAVADRSRGLFRLACGLDLVFAIAYIMLLDMKDRDQALLGDSLLSIMVLSSLYLTILRYPVYRRQYFAEHGWLRDHWGGPLWLLEWVTSPRWQPLLRLLLLASATLAIFKVWPSSVTMAVMLSVPTLLLVALTVWMGRYMQRAPGLSLLFLRVFGGKASASFTFKGLLERWQHVGLYYTIIDPERLRQRAQVVGWFRLLGGIQVIWLSALFAPLTIEPIMALLALMLALEWWLVYAPVFRMSIASRDDLSRQQNEAARKPRTSGLSFRCLEVPCYENTWQYTVEVVASRVQVILMDLRDYTRGRQGSEFEINFLLDCVPLSHVLFLVLPEEEQQYLIQRLMSELWQSVAADSPNFSLSEPYAKLFAVGMSPSGSEMQRLLDELIDIAIKRE